MLSSAFPVLSSGGQMHLIPFSIKMLIDAQFVASNNLQAVFCRTPACLVAFASFPIAHGLFLQYFELIPQHILACGSFTQSCSEFQPVTQYEADPPAPGSSANLVIIHSVRVSSSLVIRWNSIRPQAGSSRPAISR